jgi:membrane protease YdiL (CAAX protease family)
MNEGIGPDQVPWRLTDTLIVVFVGLLTWTLASSLLVYAAGPFEEGEGFTTLQVFGIILPALHLGILGTVCVLSRGLRQRREPLGVEATPADVSGVLVGLVAAAVAIAVYWLLLDVLLKVERPAQEVVEYAERAVSAGEWPFVVFSVVLLGPLAEETLFRGVLLKALQERYSDKAAAWLSAGAFTMFHLLDVNAVLAVPAFMLLGYLLARQATKTGRLGLPIFTHAGFNLFGVLMMVLT